MNDGPRLSKNNGNNGEVAEMQGTSALDWRKGPMPDEVVQLKNHRQAQLEFGLTKYQIAMAIRRRQLQPVQVGGRGRIYYLETELLELAKRVGNVNVGFHFAGAA